MENAAIRVQKDREQGEREKGEGGRNTQRGVRLSVGSERERRERERVVRKLELTMLQQCYNNAITLQRST